MADPEFAALGAVDAPPVGLVLDVFAEVYAEPPYCEGQAEVDEFARAWPGRVALPGFQLNVAVEDGRVVGFAFGFELPTDTTWWSGALGPLEVDVAEWPGRTFALFELAVVAAGRRRGIGTRLHGLTVSRVTAERVTLAVRPEPEAAPARAAYLKWGYRKVGQVRPGEGFPVYDVMVADRDALA